MTMPVSTIKRATTPAATESSLTPIACPMRPTMTAPVVRVSVHEW
jgi:hypothetical protein